MMWCSRCVMLADLLWQSDVRIENLKRDLERQRAMLDRIKSSRGEPRPLFEPVMSPERSLDDSGQGKGEASHDEHESSAVNTSFSFNTSSSVPFQHDSRSEIGSAL